MDYPHTLCQILTLKFLILKTQTMSLDTPSSNEELFSNVLLLGYLSPVLLIFALVCTIQLFSIGLFKK